MEKKKIQIDFNIILNFLYKNKTNYVYLILKILTIFILFHELLNIVENNNINK